MFRAFISNKNEVIVFNFSNIPLNGNTELLSAFSPSENIELLELSGNSPASCSNF